MEITLQYFDGCPNWRVAEQRIREALQGCAAGSYRVIYERIETAGQAEKARFRGSPTILFTAKIPLPQAPVRWDWRVESTRPSLASTVPRRSINSP